MTTVIQQRVRLRASPEALWDSYLDSKRHAALTGRKVIISRKAGTKFSAFAGMIRGRNLLVIPKRMIVQAWRAKHWKATDPDSILVLSFRKVRGGGQIDLVHVNVPGHDYQGVKKGWSTYYWKPWKSYLERIARKN